MNLVILESPYAGANPRERARNVAYARKCLRHSLLCGEAPMASHLLYTQPNVLNDSDEAERSMGMSAGWEWYRQADKCVVYADHGVSEGMFHGMNQATKFGVKVEMRYILKGKR